MYLLIDEDADARIADVFLARGHRVEFSRDVLWQSADDNLIAIAAARLSVIEADRRGAVVVTRNAKHFRRLIRREADGVATPYPKAGLICFNCQNPSQLRRIGEMIEIIEAEHEIAQRQPDPRMIVEIGEAILRIIR